MDLPSWAVRQSTSIDWQAAKKAYEAGTAKIEIRNHATLRQWMKGKGWKTPWIFLQQSFIKQLFANDKNYRTVLQDRIINLLIPRKTVSLSEKQLKEIDESYEAKSWSYVVEALREIRRVVEAGVVVNTEGKSLKSWNDWYSWAHARYGLLEEGSDKWIGDDR